MSEKPVIVRSEYVHFRSVPTRWTDNDVYGHVNNAVYYAFFDTAINDYLISEGGLEIHHGEIVGLAVETHCRFLRSLAFPDVLEVGLRVGTLGRSSVRYELAVFTPDVESAAADGYFVHVFVDRTTRRPVPIEGHLRAALARLLAAPEAAE